MEVTGRHFRLLIAQIGIAFLLICAIDLGFGWYVARTPTVPVPMLFASPLTSGKVLTFREWVRHQPTLDVLLMGLSPMMRVNCEQLRAALVERGGLSVSTFTFAGPLHTFALDERFLDSVVLPLAKPKVVVYGLTALSLVNEDKTAAQIDAWIGGFPLFKMYTGSLAARLRASFLMHSNLLLYRDVIRNALSIPRGWKGFRFNQVVTDDCGDSPLLTDAPPVQALTTWELEYRRRLANFDDVLRSTLLFGDVAEFARFCNEQGIELVLVNIPVHPLFLEILPRPEYDRYLALLREAATRAHVPLFEPVPDGVGPPDLYSDTVHENAAGGTWLTELVARYLLDNRLIEPRRNEPLASSGTGY